MTYGIYAIYDVAMKRYSQPFYHPNHEVAKRTFKIAINQPQAEHLYTIREDLELWYLGCFDDITGKIADRAMESDYPFDYGAPNRIVSRGEAVIHHTTNVEGEENNEV